MARRASLTDAGITRPSQALPPPPAPVAEAGPRPPARRGKKAVMFWVDPGASAQLRMAALSMGRSLQDVMAEALEDWFRKHRLPRLSGGESGRGEAP